MVTGTAKFEVECMLNEDVPHPKTDTLKSSLTTSPCDVDVHAVGTNDSANGNEWHGATLVGEKTECGCAVAGESVCHCKVSDEGD